MKRLLFVLLAGLCAAAIGAEDKPMPVMPDEVTLTTGRVLRKVQVVRWEKDRVVLKYSGGVDPIAFSLIAEPLRSELPVIRAASKAVATKAAAEASRQIEGQVFIVSQGRTNYKLGDLNVYFVPKEEMDNFLANNSVSSEYEKERNAVYVPMGGFPQRVVNRADAVLFEHFEKAPRGSLRTKTDADGRFVARIPTDKPLYAFARDSRNAAGTTEWYVFLREIREGDALLTLSNSDLWKPGQ
jgi:hypothetical protein